METPFELILNKLNELTYRINDIESIIKGRFKSHFTVEEVAERTGRSPYTVRTHWIKNGRLAANKLQGGKLLIEARELERFMASGHGMPMMKTKVVATSNTLPSTTVHRRFGGPVRLLHQSNLAVIARIAHEETREVLSQ
jgi:excisionase family DNA binding protein